MNKRLKKKAEKNRRADFHRILDMVLDMNGPGRRKRETTGNLPTAFFWFSGHIAEIDVSVIANGWSPQDYNPDTFSCHTDKPGESKRMIANLRRYMERNEMPNTRAHGGRSRNIDRMEEK